jgi:hypothetical protein
MGGRTTCHVIKNILFGLLSGFSNHKDLTNSSGTIAIFDPLYERVHLMYESAFLKDNSIQKPCLEVGNTGFHVVKQLFDLVT